MMRVGVEGAYDSPAAAAWQGSQRDRTVRKCRPVSGPFKDSSCRTLLASTPAYPST